jgi:transcriptional regulator with PAS, ATPase and Fis domain
MSEGRPHSPGTSAPSRVEGAAIARVSFEDLTRMPAPLLARLLLERAAEDPTLLNRLYETVDPNRNAVPPAAPPAVPRASAPPPAIIGDSPAMRRVNALVRRFGQTDEPVLITGESGTGKELLARAIHDGSRRARGPFVPVNCAAIPAGLVASELFGYEKGAFTGAAARSLGQLEYANGGTLFLDEIGDMPIDLQAHLLRFLQEGQIRRVGGRETIALDVRIVSATNVRLSQAITDCRFRQDMFYRLNVLTLPVPPLRERPEDIIPLAEHFLHAAQRDFNRQVEGFSAAAVVALQRYTWPGNVRELMSVVRRAVIVGDGKLIEAATLAGLDDPPEPPQGAPGPRSPLRPRSPPRPHSPEERAALLTTLERTGENVTSTADALGVSRVTLYRMLRRHGIALKRGLAEPPIARRPHHAHG